VRRPAPTNLDPAFVALEKRAAKLGAAAFERGLMAPALDNDMLDLMREVNPSGIVGDPHTVAVLKAWHSGNTIARLNWSETQ
jgi:hypothetical protein